MHSGKGQNTFYIWFDGKHIQLFHVSLVAVCAQINNKYFPNLSWLMQFQATTLKMWVKTTINQWENQLNWMWQKRNVTNQHTESGVPFLCLRLKAPEALCLRAVCPFVHPSVRSLKLPLSTCTWVRWSIRPFVTVFRHVRPSVCPSGEVSGHLLENAWREWSEILHVNVSWKPSELVRPWSWSVDFFKLWHYFDLVKRVKFGVSRHFLENAWREWPELLHVYVSWAPSEMCRLWSHFVDFANFGSFDLLKWVKFGDFGHALWIFLIMVLWLKLVICWVSGHYLLHVGVNVKGGRRHISDALRRVLSSWYWSIT